MTDRKPTPCPICGHTLSVVLYGLMPEEVWEELRAEPIEYIVGGCTFGKLVFICPECDAHFNNDLKPLKDCILLYGNEEHLVTNDECKNYDCLKRQIRGELPEAKEFICNEICPVKDKKLRIRKKDGTVWEGYFSRVKNDILEATKRQKGYLEKELFPISEIESVSEVKPDPD